MVGSGGLVGRSWGISRRKVGVSSYILRLILSDGGKRMMGARRRHDQSNLRRGVRAG